MTLTQNGIDYICQNFGDTNFCCVNSGLGWVYTAAGVPYNETGGTAQIVSRLASGLIESLQMTNPARGIFTQADLNAANGATVTIQDAVQIANHDEPAEGQYCFEQPPPSPVCADYFTEAECTAGGCYWYNESCHDSPPSPITCYRCKPVGDGYTVPESQVFEEGVCPEGWFPTQPTCNPPPGAEIPWMVPAVIGGIILGVIVVGAVIISKKR